MLVVVIFSCCKSLYFAEVSPFLLIFRLDPLQSAYNLSLSMESFAIEWLFRHFPNRLTTCHTWPILRIELQAIKFRFFSFQIF